MKNRYFALFYIAIVTTVAIVFSACKKINESTDLGGGLIPPVDNITTFDTLIDVQTYNDTFSIVNDSTRIGHNISGYFDEFFLGKITNDPFFGTSEAQIFLQLKPPSYPFAFRNKAHPDSLFIDSVVLILDYVETYGDTLAPQTVTVQEMDQSSANAGFKYDSVFLLRRNNFTTFLGGPLGSRTFSPAALKDSVKAFGGDTTTHQLRIKLNNSFGHRLLMYDSSSTGGYANDSTFTSKVKGFAIKSTAGGNALMGFNLPGANTKLAIYYKYANSLPNIDTTVAYFTFGSLSASANYAIRNYIGTPADASLNNGPAQDQVVYLQNTPGFFTTVKFPGLGTISNRVIHRAELVMEQIYDISDSTFRPPDFMYADAIDPTITDPVKFRTIPYDFTYEPSSGLFNLASFGVAPVLGTDPFGNKIRIWRLNISRYVQHVLTGTVPLYDLRLFPAFRYPVQFGIPPGSNVLTTVSVNPAAIKGRIRLGGGNHPTQRMKLRLIYSKL